MKCNNVVQLFFLLFMGITSARADDTDYATMLKNLPTDTWVRTDTLRWARRLELNNKNTAVVVQYQENRKRVLFRTWTLCDNPNELDTTHWIADELFGTRIDCKNAVSTVSIPHDLEEKLADLPVPISTILKIERGLIRTRPPTTLLRS